MTIPTTPTGVEVPQNPTRLVAVTFNGGVYSPGFPFVLFVGTSGAVEAKGWNNAPSDANVIFENVPAGRWFEPVLQSITEAGTDADDLIAGFAQ